MRTTMEILSVSKALSLPHIVRASYSKSKISVPINSASIGYARFKHIKGVPSFAGGSGFSVTRLKQLDTMIDFISRMKNEAVSVDLGSGDESALERLTEEYSKLVRDKVVSPFSDYNTGIYSPGSLLNMTA